MRYSKKLITAGIILFIIVLAIAAVWFQHQYLLAALVLVTISIAPFFIRFEAKKTDAKEIVLISMLTAVASASRVLFAPLPNFKPTSFVVIMTGMVFGPESGFMVGALAAIISNIFFGQGPWTPWQMFAWGMMGASAGLFQCKKWLDNKYIRVSFGFVWGFIFGWIMDLWFIIGYITPLTGKAFLGGFVSSSWFDLIHALSNVFFLGLLSKSWLKMFRRIKLKYGLLEH